LPWIAYVRSLGLPRPAAYLLGDELPMKSYSKNISTSWMTIDERFIPPFVTSGLTPGWTSSLSCPQSNKGDLTTPTSWSYTAHDVYNVHGSAVLTGIMSFNKGMRIISTGNLADSGMPVPEWDNRNAVYNLALSRLNDKVRGSLDLSIALGESRTTIRMLKNTAKLLSFARLRMPPGGFGSSRDVANGYLQWKYGWKPLLSDVFDAANESISICVNHISKVHASAKLPLSGAGSVRYGSVHNTPNVPFVRVFDGGWTQGGFQGCKVGVTLEVPQNVHNASRWTSLNPLSITWELIPFSFVADWFLDIGSYLRNLETGLLYNSVFKTGYKSELFRASFTDECQFYQAPIPLGSQFETKLFGLVAEYRHVEFLRTRLASYPLPHRPTFKVDLGSSQLFSAAALLRQLIGKK